MKIIVKGTFDRDIDKVRSSVLRKALEKRINQIEKAKDTSHITGLKLLRGYSHHFRLIVKTQKESFRIGAIIRGEKIWLVRFLPRKIIYKIFP